MNPRASSADRQRCGREPGTGDGDAAAAVHIDSTFVSVWTHSTRQWAYGGFATWCAGVGALRTEMSTSTHDGSVSKARAMIRKGCVSAPRRLTMSSKYSAASSSDAAPWIGSGIPGMIGAEWARIAASRHWRMVRMHDCSSATRPCPPAAGGASNACGGTATGAGDGDGYECIDCCDGPRIPAIPGGRGGIAGRDGLMSVAGSGMPAGDAGA